MCNFSDIIVVIVSKPCCVMYPCRNEWSSQNIFEQQPSEINNKCAAMSENVIFVHVRPAKIRISLSIRAVWSQSSLSAFWIAKDANFLPADNEDSDQTERSLRMIRVFVRCTCQKARFLTVVAQIEPATKSIVRRAISEDSDQPAHPRSLIRVFANRMCLLQPPGYPKRDERKPLPNWEDVQAYLSLCWSHRSYCRFCRALALISLPIAIIHFEMNFDWLKRMKYW